MYLASLHSSSVQFSPKLHNRFFSVQGVGLVIGAYAGWKYYKKWLLHKSARQTRETLRDIIRERQTTTEGD